MEDVQIGRHGNPRQGRDLNLVAGVILQPKRHISSKTAYDRTFIHTESLEAHETKHITIKINLHLIHKISKKKYFMSVRWDDKWCPKSRITTGNPLGMQKIVFLEFDEEN